MGAITKRVLSSSTDGQIVDLSASTSKVIHTGSSLTTTIDEVFVWALNSATNAFNAIFEHGGSASQTWQVQIPAKGADPKLIIPGWLVQGNASPITISGHAISATTVLSIVGYVNRLDQS